MRCWLLLISTFKPARILRHTRQWEPAQMFSEVLLLVWIMCWWPLLFKPVNLHTCSSTLAKGPIICPIVCRIFAHHNHAKAAGATGVHVYILMQPCGSLTRRSLPTCAALYDQAMAFDGIYSSEGACPPVLLYNGHPIA